MVARVSVRGNNNEVEYDSEAEEDTSDEETKKEASDEESEEETDSDEETTSSDEAPGIGNGETEEVAPIYGIQESLAPCN